MWAAKPYLLKPSSFRFAIPPACLLLGPDHPVVATDLMNLAEVLKNKGDFAAAEPLFRHALEIDEKVLGSDDPEVAVMLDDLAAILHANGDLAGAEPLYRRALAIDEKLFGPDNPDMKRRWVRTIPL
jgi:tetratricopeptide (TPR) repeat protein